MNQTVLSAEIFPLFETHWRHLVWIRKYSKLNTDKRRKSKQRAELMRIILYHSTNHVHLYAFTKRHLVHY